MNKYTSKIIPLVFITILVIVLLNVIYKSIEVESQVFYPDEGELISLFIENEEGEYERVTTDSEEAANLMSSFDGNYNMDLDLSTCYNGVINSYDRETGNISIRVEDSTSSVTTKCNFYFYYDSTIEEPVNLYQQILINNGAESGAADSFDDAVDYIEGKDTPTFSNTATTDEGMFATEDDYGTSYYFRGAVDDNWVIFGQEDTDGDGEMEDIYWRIIRIDGEGNIRMIYSGTTAPTESTRVVMTGDGTQIDASTYNGILSVKIEVEGTTYSMYRTLMGVQYVYTAGEIHGDSTPSVIKTVVDDWFDVNIKSSEDDYQFIATTTYCNDRTYYTDTTGTTLSTSVFINTSSSIYFGAYTRRSSSSPSLSCLSTVDALELEVALITADEVMFAGSKGTSNSNYYLYTNQSYWTLSPSYLYSTHALVFYVGSSGNLTNYFVYYSFGVRPVVSLTSGIFNFSGTGTYDDPYKIE